MCPHRRRFLSHGVCLAAGAGLGWVAATSFPEAFALDVAETPEQRLKKLGVELPKPTTPRPTLVPAVKVGNMLYVSGHLPPPKDGKPVVGKVGKDMTEKEAHEAARSVALVILAVVRQQVGTLDNVVQLVKTLGMVNCTPEFTQQPAVINGFSEVMIQVFGEKAGKGARSAVGMAGLPGGGPVEVECIFQVKG